MRLATMLQHPAVQLSELCRYGANQFLSRVKSLKIIYLRLSWVVRDVMNQYAAIHELEGRTTVLIFNERFEHYRQSNR